MSLIKIFKIKLYQPITQLYTFVKSNNFLNFIFNRKKLTSKYATSIVFNFFFSFKNKFEILTTKKCKITSCTNF